MNTRIKALIACVVEFIVFSILSISLFILFFKLALLSLPFSAFMWTFWGFNVFTLVFGIKILKRYTFSYAVLNFFAVGILIFAIFGIGGFAGDDFKRNLIIASVAVGILYLLLSVHFIRIYWCSVKEEVLRWFGKDVSAKEERNSDSCATKYPVFFVHGVGFRDRKILNYWGSIPRLLEECGAKVFFSDHDAWANTEDAASQIVENLKKVLEEAEAEKVNVIAHSRGGIDIRYAISKFGINSNIASVTMISSPNRGSKTLDALYNFLGEKFFKFAAVFVNLWFKILGDKEPDFFTATYSLRASSMEKFNQEIKDDPSVPVQTFAGKMRGMLSDIIMSFTYFVLRFSDGDNDGIVGVESAKWGNFRGLLEGKGFFGLSHVQEVDGYRTNPALKEHEGLPAGSKTIRDFYLSLVHELKEKEL